MRHPTRRRHRLARPLLVAVLSPAMVVGLGAATGAQALALDDLAVDEIIGCEPIPGLTDCDEEAPETTITGSAPAPVDGMITSRSVTFSFTGSDNRGDAALSFECRLITPAEDNPSWLPCDEDEGAAYAVGDAPLESYRFEVRATDDAITFPNAPRPNTDETPAAYSFGVDTVPPQTRRFSGPSFYQPSRDAEFVHGSSDASATYVCTLDGRPLTCDQDYLALRRLSSGRHRLKVAAVDRYGNADPTPVTTTWWVPRNSLGTRAERARWRRVMDVDAFDKDVVTTAVRRATLSAKLRGVRAVGLVVRTEPGAGRLRVKFNRTTLKVIGLDDRRIGSQTVFMDLPGRKKRSGTLRVIPIDRAPVTVDAYFAS